MSVRRWRLASTARVRLWLCVGSIMFARRSSVACCGAFWRDSSRWLPHLASARTCVPGPGQFFCWSQRFLNRSAHSCRGCSFPYWKTYQYVFHKVAAPRRAAEIEDSRPKGGSRWRGFWSAHWRLRARVGRCSVLSCGVPRDRVTLSRCGCNRSDAVEPTRFHPEDGLAALDLFSHSVLVKGFVVRSWVVVSSGHVVVSLFTRRVPRVPRSFSGAGCSRQARARGPRRSDRAALGGGPPPRSARPFRSLR